MIGQRQILGKVIAEGSEVPPRPKLTISERSFGPFNGLNPNKIFRLTWSLHLNPNHARISKYEIFACIQRLNSSEISKWTKIGEINAKKKHNAEGEVVMSRRMLGFKPEFRYQIVVRGVDIFGRMGSFSKPEDIGI